MRTPVALRAALGLVFLAHLAGAETPASRTPEPSAPARPSAPAPAPAPAPGSTPAVVEALAPAQDAGPVVVPAENDQPPLEPIPNAHDTLGGHFVLGAAVGPRWPFGDLSSTRNQQDYMGAALAVNLDLGYGLSRNVVIGAWGEFDNHYAPSGCKQCSAQSFAGGPFVRYHLVQGTRFDPWGSFALGYRAISVDTGPSTLHYYGYDFLRLTVGGDWYPTSNIGIGPYFTFDAGTYGSHVHTGLSTGLRLVFDLPGK